MRWRVVGAFVAALVVIAAVALLRNNAEQPVASREASTATPAPDFTPLSHRRPEGQAAPDYRETGLPPIAAVTPIPLSQGEERSPLADTLNSPQGTPEQDIAVVLRLFDYYLERFSALPAAATNAEFVNALTGNNPRRIALIERSHPAINPAGELTDRWGTPFFFHLVAHDQIEIRSAGPDKAMWNEDDLLTASASLAAARHRAR